MRWDAQVVDDVARRLEGGDVVVLPTDTVYGLVALASDAAAVDRLFELKGRGDDVPIAVLCADAAQAFDLAAPTVGPAAHAVAERWWPGPLTLVLPRRAGLALALGGSDATIGVRVPDHDLVRAVAGRVGPLAATSANRHGRPTPVTAEAVAAALGDGVALVVDGGPSRDGASAVVDATGTPWRVLRDGPIAGSDILDIAASAEVPGGDSGDASASTHYRAGPTEVQGDAR